MIWQFFSFFGSFCPKEKCPNSTNHYILHIGEAGQQGYKESIFKSRVRRKSIFAILLYEYLERLHIFDPHMVPYEKQPVFR